MPRHEPYYRLISYKYFKCILSYMDIDDINSCYSELSYCEGYFGDLIELYNKFLKLNINIYFFNKTLIKSKSHSGELCKLIRDRYPNICSIAKQKENSPFPLCKAGLICYKFPINISDSHIGEFCVGQKLIKDKIDESKNLIIDSLEREGANPTEKEYFISLFDKLDIIDDLNEEDLNAKVQFIKKHFYIEFNRSYYTEKRVGDLKRLAENLAHQFITPIQGIMGDAQILISDYGDLPAKCQIIEIKDMSDNIFMEIQKLSLCADNLRNWIASEHNWLYNYDFKERPILPIIMHSIKLFRNEAKSRGILIRDPTFDGAAPPKLRISSEHMTRVFYNLISNAVKYSYDGTPNNFRWIETKCKIELNFYCIDITNYGIGILPEEIEKKIFSVGYRGKLAKDRNRYGSGLGLGVVKKIIEDHGGKIKILSEIQGDKDFGTKNPYKTTIRICLPLLNE